MKTLKDLPHKVAGSLTTLHGRWVVKRRWFTTSWSVYVFWVHLSDVTSFSIKDTTICSLTCKSYLSVRLDVYAKPQQSTWVCPFCERPTSTLLVIRRHRKVSLMPSLERTLDRMVSSWVLRTLIRSWLHPSSRSCLGSKSTMKG